MNEEKSLEELCKEMQNAENRLFEAAPKMKNPKWWEDGSPEKVQEEK